MSANLAYAEPLSSPAPALHPRHIEIAATRAQRRARPKVMYAVVTVASLFVIFAAQLLLSIVVSEGAYQISSLQDQQKELLRTQDYLNETLQKLDSTQNLTTQASHLGMVPNAGPLALDLGTGAVYPLPGSADPMGCGGACNLVGNSLVAGIPLVNPAGPAAAVPPAAVAPVAGNAAATAPADTAAPQTGQAPAASDGLPAPVTH